MLKTVARFRSLRRNAVLSALFLLIQGIFFIARPNTDPTGTGKLIAALLIIAGAGSIVSYLVAKDRTLVGTLMMVLSCVVVIAGILLYIHSDTMVQILRYAVALMVAASGAAGIIEAVKLGKSKRWQFIVGLIVGIFLVGLGVAMLVASIEVSTIMKRALGFVFVLGAIVQLVSAVQMTETIKNSQAA